MPYSPLHLQNLTELKLRVGNATDTVIATILGLNYPTTEGFSVYVWNNLSTATADDNEIVTPTSRIGMGGRWFKVDLLALHSESDPIWNSEKINYLTETESDAKYLQEFIENDPTVASYIKSITSTDISNWNAKLSVEVDPTVPEYIKEIQQIDIDSWNEKVGENRQLTVNGVTYTLEADRTWTVGDLSSAGSYANPSWITSLPATKISGLSTVSTTGDYNDLTALPNLSNYYLASNPNGYISSVPAQTWTSITGKPTFSTVATSGSYLDLSNKPTIPAVDSASVISALGFTPYNSTNPNGYVNQTGARTAINLTTLGTSGASTYDNSTGTINVPNYTGNTYTAGLGITIASNVISQTTPTYNNSPARALTTSFRPSTTRPTRVSYTCSIVTALSLLNLNSSGIVQLQISSDNTNWTTINSAGVTRTLAVSITVGLNETTMINVAGEIPANFYCRLSPTTAGGATVTVSSGQEVTY